MLKNWKFKDFKQNNKQRVLELYRNLLKEENRFGHKFDMVAG